MKKLLLALLLFATAQAHAAGAWVQSAFSNTGIAYVNISPTSGHTLLWQSVTSNGGGSPTVTAVQAMSAANGGGSVLATFTIPTPLATAATTTSTVYHITGAYLLSLPAGVASVLATYNGGTPGTTILAVAEVSGVSTYNIATQQGQGTPGTGSNAITSGNASVSSAPAYLLGFSVDMNNNSGQVAGSSFTARTAANNYAALVEDGSAGSTGSYAATATDASHGGTDIYVTTIFALTSGATCTHAGWTASGALTVPTVSVTSVWVPSEGKFDTVDCSSKGYSQPSNSGATGTS